MHLNNNRALTLPKAIALYRYVVNLRKTISVEKGKI